MHLSELGRPFLSACCKRQAHTAPLVVFWGSTVTAMDLGLGWWKQVGTGDPCPVEPIPSVSA